MRIPLGAFFFAVIIPWGLVFGAEPIFVLSPSDVPPNFTNNFGASKAIDENFVAVGAPRDPWYSGDAYGAVYVFRRLGPTWIEQTKLTAPDLDWEDQLGFSVDMDGDVIVAGAPHYSTNFPDQNGPGAVYVFRRNDGGTPGDRSDDTWSQEARLVAPNAQRGQSFGYSVAISGNVIVGGRRGNYESAEVFEWNGLSWSHAATLLGADPLIRYNFGSVVDVDAGRVAVGAPRNPNIGTGAVYVFVPTDSGWVEEQRLVPADHTTPDNFGISVSIAGRHIAVGDSSIGMAYVFVGHGTEWTQQDMFDSTPRTAIGSDLRTDGHLLVASAAGQPWGYLFERQSSDWVQVDGLLGIGEAFVPANVALGASFAIVSRNIYAVSDQRSLSEFSQFECCLAVGDAPTRECRRWDFTGDGTVDLVDFEIFMGTYVGP